VTGLAFLAGLVEDLLQISARLLECFELIAALLAIFFFDDGSKHLLLLVNVMAMRRADLLDVFSVEEGAQTLAINTDAKIGTSVRMEDL